MKKIFLFVLVIGSLSVFAQQTGEKNDKKAKPENEAADRLVIGFSFDNWIYNRGEIDSLKTKWNSWGIHIYYMYDIPMGKSRFSFAPGLGFSASWVKNNSSLDESVDSLGTFFTLVKIGGKEISYKRNSLVTSYFDVPLELRYRAKPNSKNKNFKLAVGVIGGIQMTNHTKTKTSDKSAVPSGQTKVFKESGYDDLSRFRFGPTFRIGYGSMNLFFYYSVTNLFKKDKGPDVHPFSAGFSINGL